MSASDDDYNRGGVRGGSLHAQIRAFARDAAPDADDVERRAAMFRKIDEGVRAAFPAARVHVFGSGATGLALKGASRSISHWSPYGRVGVVNADP